MMLAQIVFSTEIQIAATVVIVAIAGLLSLMLYGRSWLSAIWSKVSGGGTGKIPMSLRSADQPAPKGTAEYLRDLSAAAPEAPAEFVLKQALNGSTIAACQRDWIAELLKQRKGAT